MKLRKYHTRENHGLIYVWLHADENVPPQFEYINVEKFINHLDYRGFTYHSIRSHVQDIPENGADIFHFKYVHKKVISFIDSISFVWTPRWMRGDDPDLPSLFEC